MAATSATDIELTEGDQKKIKSAASKKKEEARAEALRNDLAFVEHTWEMDKLWKHFGSTINGGLSSEQVKINRAKYGENRVAPPKLVPAWRKFIAQFENFFAVLLLVGGTLCFIGYELDRTDGDNVVDQTNVYLGAVLYIVVTITAVFSFMQEAKSEKIMEGFKGMIPKKCKAIRDGNTEVLDPWELVPGDVVLVNDGDQVPADLRVIEANELQVDNSSLTGESEPVDRGTELFKDDKGNLITQPMEANNIIFYTTLVQSGACKAVVIGTGDNTAMGQIAGLTLDTQNQKTPIAVELEKFIMLISAVAITLGIVFFIIGHLTGTEIIKNLVFVIGIIVANVPEGLLATVTVSLALTALRMHGKNVLVKNLQAVETLGSTTVIASDKTGTLTQNRMTVQHCWYGDQLFSTPAAKNRPEFEQMTAVPHTGGEFPCFDPNSKTFKKLQMVSTLCNNSEFLLKDANDEGAVAIDLAAKMKEDSFDLLKMDCTGDASESGLIKFLQPNEDVMDFRARYPKEFEIKFNSTNKWQLSIHKEAAGAGRVLVLKGAPERVLKMCTKIHLGVDGEEPVPLTDELREKYEAANERLGSLGERVLGFAYKQCTEPEDFEYKNKPEPNFKHNDLVFAGLLSLIDPPRPGVPEAVAKCKRASIKVFMVTGDHPITARAIAEQVGIIDKHMWDAGKATVVKGDDIREWMELPKAECQAKWDAALDHQQIVWARVSPAHKLLIVENCQRRKEIVAVTGDGVNDAPALKKGNIGVAMGIAGKDISKEAADMILMDDNFSSIVNGVEEGRLIFDNLKKSIAYTLTSNIPEIAPFLLFITARIPLPLSTVLILMVDLCTDMAPAISLAYESKESDIMDRPPRNSETDRLVNRRLISFSYLQIGFMQALAGFFTYMVVLNDYGYTPKTLVGNGFEWGEYSLMCTFDENGPLECGYGCKSPTADLGDFCEGGCAIPMSGDAVDPFSEMTDTGFRGFQDGDPCGRSCAWFGELSDADKNALAADEKTAFDTMCAEDDTFGFGGRKKVSPLGAEAPEGSFYWWDGQAQRFPNPGYQRAALEFAQTAYFIAIIVVQWADLLIAKTRKLSVFQQGMSNGFMNFGLIFETLMGALFCYTPVLNVVFSTRPIQLIHWLPAVPWSILIFVYDEIRKMLMRKAPGGWLERFTYW